MGEKVASATTKAKRIYVNTLYDVACPHLYTLYVGGEISDGNLASIAPRKGTITMYSLMSNKVAAIRVPLEKIGYIADKLLEKYWGKHTRTADIAYVVELARAITSVLDLDLDMEHDMYTSINTADLFFTTSQKYVLPAEIIGEEPAVVVGKHSVYVVVPEKIMGKILAEARIPDKERFASEMRVGNDVYAVPIAPVTCLWTGKLLHMPRYSENLSPVMLSETYREVVDIPFTAIRVLGATGLDYAVEFLSARLGRIHASMMQRELLKVFVPSLNPMYTAYILALLHQHHELLDKRERKYLEGLAALAYLRHTKPVLQAEILVNLARMRSGIEPLKPVIMSTDDEFNIKIEQDRVVISIPWHEEFFASLKLTGREDLVLMSHLLAYPDELVKHLFSAGPPIGLQVVNVNMREINRVVRTIYPDREGIVNLFLSHRNPLTTMLVDRLVSEHGVRTVAKYSRRPPMYMVEKINIKSVAKAFIVKHVSWGHQPLQTYVSFTEPSIPLKKLMGEASDGSEAGNMPELLEIVLVPEIHGLLADINPRLLSLIRVALGVVEPYSFGMLSISAQDSSTFLSLKHVLSPVTEIDVHITLDRPHRIMEEPLRIVNAVRPRDHIEVMPGGHVRVLPYMRTYYIDLGNAWAPMTLFRPLSRMLYVGTVEDDSGGKTVVMLYDNIYMYIKYSRAFSVERIS